MRQCVSRHNCEVRVFCMFQTLTTTSYGDTRNECNILVSMIPAEITLPAVIAYEAEQSGWLLQVPMFHNNILAYWRRDLVDKLSKDDDHSPSVPTKGIPWSVKYLKILMIYKLEHHHAQLMRGPVNIKPSGKTKETASCCK